MRTRAPPAATPMLAPLTPRPSGLVGAAFGAPSSSGACRPAMRAVGIWGSLGAGEQPGLSP